MPKSIKFIKEHNIDSIYASFSAAKLKVFDFNEITIQDKS